jgi:CDP-diacylglycerol pyrophosphatase
MAAIPNVQQPAAAVAVVAPAAPRSSSSLLLKVWRAVSFVFENILRVSAGVILAAVVTGNLSAWSLLSSIALLAVAQRASAARQKMHDFENPQELQKLRAAAPYMGYSELKKTFKLSDLKQYNLLPAEGINSFKHKVLLHLSTPANFDYMCGVFGERQIEDLLEHDMIDGDIAMAVRNSDKGRIQALLNAYQ